MKLSSSLPGASIKMAADPALLSALAALLAKTGTDVVIETGTFLGTGSTRLICGAFPPGAPPRRFVTIEVNFANWCRARWNLRHLPYVDCRWGRSVPTDRGLEFMRSDVLLTNHQNYPDIYIADTIDPIGFYTREMMGTARELEGQPLSAGGASIPDDARALLFEGDDLLGRMLAVHADHAPLLALDSAGGVGFLEFQIVLERMVGKRFTLLLDDTNRVKHWRSLQFIRNSSEFQIVGEGETWVLATRL